MRQSPGAPRVCVGEMITKSTTPPEQIMASSKVTTRTTDVRLVGIGGVLSIADLEAWRGRVSPQPVAPEPLKRLFAQFAWDQMFVKLSGLACILANKGPLSAAARSWTHDLGRAFESSLNTAERDMARYVAAHPDRGIASEQTLYFAQAMALLYGATEGPTPHDGNLVHLLLACNDYAFTWIEDDPTLTRKERGLVDQARAATFNEFGDRVLKMVRGALLLTTPPDPTRTRWQSPDAWEALQRRAFGGRTVTEYVMELAGPLHVHSLTWGSDANAPGCTILDVDGWMGPTPADAAAGADLLRSLTATPDELRALLRGSLNADALPVGSAVFSRTPFVALSDTRVVPASPWAVGEHLRLGLWAKMMAAAKEEFAPKANAGAKAWLSTFGELVERWCHQQAEHAAQSPAFVGRVLPRSLTGDEVEDVVMVNGNKAVLFSVKSRLIRDDVHKQARSSRAVVQLYDGMLFGDATDEFRVGAVRQLSASVERVRARRYEPDLDHRVEVFPVLVTFDEMGLDTPGAYQWMRTRMNALRLRLPRNTHAVTFVTVSEFERLMALAEHGHDLTRLLALKTSPQWADARLDVLISREVRDASHARSSFMSGEFERISNTIFTGLFPGRRLPDE